MLEHLVVVTYPEPLAIEAREIEHDSVAEGNVGLAYFYDENMIARSVVDSEAMESIHNLLEKPVLVALAAAEDEHGNIEGRVCLVLPVDGETLRSDEDESDEPWKASVPPPPAEISSYDADHDQDERPKMALLPIGNVIRTVQDRNHPQDVAADASEMLRNLLTGRAKDSVQKAIDDLLDNL